MKEIGLTMGYVTIVDDEDFEMLNLRSWHAKPSGKTCYAVTSIRDGHGRAAKVVQLSMHRLLLKPSEEELVDHINGNGLDNRRANLRRCTHAQNIWNRADSGGKLVGVSFHKGNQKWMSRIRVNGKSISIGYFDTQEEAVAAYDIAALRYHGEFAVTNIPYKRMLAALAAAVRRHGVPRG